ncbi:MAG: hypothetical protein IPJ74_27225 [Saprospiraceae bacterium]|nr:hypothetical protein [Saprospiraceae bacterium]
MATTKNADHFMKLSNYLLPILALVTFIGTACEQTPQPSLFSQWNQQELLELEIATDLEALLGNAEQEQTALITWLDANGTTQ